MFSHPITASAAQIAEATRMIKNSERCNIEFGAWSVECLEVAGGSRELAADLYASWQVWSERNGCMEWSGKRMCEFLIGNGCVSRRTAAGMAYLDLRLRVEPRVAGDKVQLI